MRKNQLLSAPRVTSPPSTAGKWEREHLAFLDLRSSLLETHQGKYVAVHEGKVVASGENKISLGLQVYSAFGYVPIYVGKVAIEQQPPIRVTNRHRRAFTSD